MKASNTATIIVTASVLFAIAQMPAAAVYRQLWDQGGPTCQLSVPTTASKVRPRANGMRNEGTNNEFVICQYSNSSNPYSQAAIYLTSFDGVAHTVQCTAMNGNIAAGAFYSTKTATTDTTPTGVVGLLWLPTDLGAPGSIFANPMFSVTCTLPPGASIMGINGVYEE